MELLERFAAGDLEAFEALFRQHQSEVYRCTVRIVRDTGLSEDYPAATRGDPAVHSELRGHLRRAFLELPAKYRLVATLALIEEEPYGEIAQAAGISAALVKVRVFRAVRMLRKKLNYLGVEATVK